MASGTGWEEEKKIGRISLHQTAGYRLLFLESVTEAPLWLSGIRAIMPREPAY